MNARCSAMDAATAILDWHWRNGCGASNLRLNFLLYFVQAWHLVHSKGRKACFPERIEAWSFGPIVPEVYAKYRGYGSLDIPYAGNEESAISRQDREAIDAVVEHFSSYSLFDLHELVCHQRPWQIAFHPLCNMEIRPKVMTEYFLEEIS